MSLPPSLPLPRRETLQQSSSLSTVSPATVDLTLKVMFGAFILEITYLYISNKYHLAKYLFWDLNLNVACFAFEDIIFGTVLDVSV